LACVVERRGRWMLDLRDGTGRRRWKITRWPATPENKPKAEKLLVRLEVQAESGHTYETRREQKNFTQLAAAYLAGLTVRALTRHDYECIIRSRLLPYFGQMKLHAVTAQEVEQFRAAMQRERFSAVP